MKTDLVTLYREQFNENTDLRKQLADTKEALAEEWGDGAQLLAHAITLEDRAFRAEEKLQEAKLLIEQLVACHYECVAGPLENNVDYQKLLEILARPPSAPGGETKHLPRTAGAG